MHKKHSYMGITMSIQAAFQWRLISFLTVLSPWFIWAYSDNPASDMDEFIWWESAVIIFSRVVTWVYTVLDVEDRSQYDMFQSFWIGLIWFIAAHLIISGPLVMYTHGYSTLEMIACICVGIPLYWLTCRYPYTG